MMTGTSISDKFREDLLARGGVFHSFFLLLVVSFMTSGRANVRRTSQYSSDMPNGEDKMTVRTRSTFPGIALALGLLIVSAHGHAQAPDNKYPPPPYQVAGGHHVLIGVAWDAAVRKALPAGIKPTADLAGAINIYTTELAGGIGTYSAAYLWLDIEGYDSPDGIKGRWMLAGIYGPQAKTSAALRQYYNLPLRQGTAQIEPNSDGLRAVGRMNGHDLVIAEIKPTPNACSPAAAQVNYISLASNQRQINVARLPFALQFCKAEPVSVRIVAPDGDPFASFPIAKVLWAAEARNNAFAFVRPELVPRR